MIGFVIGTVAGILAALIYGKFKGRAGELTMAAVGIPLFTYISSSAFYDGWRAIPWVFMGTPFGDLTPDEVIGLETSLALSATLAYVWLRSEKALTIDEMVGNSLVVGYTLAAGAGLAASGGLLSFLLSLGLFAGFTYLSIRNPRRSLKAAPCGEDLRALTKNRELDCLTDDVSYNVYRSGNTLLVGGKAVKEFPRWREVAECMADFPGGWQGKQGFRLRNPLSPDCDRVCPPSGRLLCFNLVLACLCPDVHQRSLHG